MKKMIVILSLVLILCLCAGAAAEEAAPIGVPAAPAEVPAAPAEAPAADAAAAETEKSAAELALEAWARLKGSARVKSLDALGSELDAYVEEGKLTREQADLILAYYTEHPAALGAKARGQKTGAKAGKAGRLNAGDQAETQPAQPDGKGQKRGGQNMNGTAAPGKEHGRKAPGAGSEAPQGDDSGADTSSGATKKGK